MGATKNRSIANTKINGLANPQSCELFSRYGAAIYGMLLRTLECEKLSEEILVKTFLTVETNEIEKDWEANSYFRKLLAVSMSMVAGCNTRPSVKNSSEEKSFEGLLGKMGSSPDDRNVLGKAIRKQLRAFRKG